MKIIINESQYKKLILKEGNNPTGNTTNNLYAKLTDDHSYDLFKKLANYDEDKLEDLQHKLSLGLLNKHNSNWVDTLNHNLHAHVDLHSNHVKLEFPHLGPHHDIKLEIEGSLGHKDDHGNKPISLELEPTFGGTFKIPIYYNSKH